MLSVYFKLEKLIQISNLNFILPIGNLKKMSKWPTVGFEMTGQFIDQQIFSFLNLS